MRGTVSNRRNLKHICVELSVSQQGGGGQIRHFSNKSTMKQYFKKLISHKRRVFLALSLLQCQSLPISFVRAVKRENVPYIVKGSLYRGAKSGSRSQPTSLYSTGNISAQDSVHNNKVGHNSAHGTVSSMLFFPQNYCFTKSTFPTSYVD
jgi:hypothetical protein